MVKALAQERVDCIEVSWIVDPAAEDKALVRSADIRVPRTEVCAAGIPV